VFIKRIEDRDGHVIEEAAVVPIKVIEQSTAYIMTSLMESVVQKGTGQKVKALNRPAAGKTGTTNNLFDAWFVGYTPEYITGTWVGFDEEKSLGHGETGSQAASPIWLEFMQKALNGRPVTVFQVPEGVVFSKIDADTGLLPIPTSRNTAFECFKEGAVPTKRASNSGTITSSEQFFKSDL
jgi:penicillin-binding protein 1A